MDFAKRLSRVVAAATWSSLLLAIAGVLVVDRYDARVHVHLIAFWLWCIVGALVAMALTILPFSPRHNARVEEEAWIYRLTLLCADVLFVSAVVAVSGGLNGPMWMLYVPLVLFASVATRQWQGLVVGFASSHRPGRGGLGLAHPGHAQPGHRPRRRGALPDGGVVQRHAGRRGLGDAQPAPTTTTGCRPASWS